MREEKENKCKSVFVENDHFIKEVLKSTILTVTVLQTYQFESC